MKYRHYGSKDFSIAKIEESLSGEGRMSQNKPQGLWACPTNAERSWESFFLEEWHTEFSDAEKEDFRSNFFEFEISSDANILHINREEDISEYKMCVPHFEFIELLDVEKLRDDYDGIAFHIDKNPDLYWGFFYGWDVESVCVWNADVIIPL